MTENSKTIIALPESPYRILDVPFDADVKVINKAMRQLFRKDPRRGGQIGNRAQKKLTDPMERIKEDAFCCEVQRPQIDLNPLKKEAGRFIEDVYCFALEDPFLYSDLYFSDRLDRQVKLDVDPGEIPYREKYDRRKKQ